MNEYLVMEVGSGRRIGWLRADFSQMRKHPDPTIGIVFYQPQTGLPIPLAYDRSSKKPPKWLWVRPDHTDVLVAQILHFRPARRPQRRSRVRAA